MTGMARWAARWTAMMVVHRAEWLDGLAPHPAPRLTDLVRARGRAGIVDWVWWAAHDDRPPLR